MIFKRGFAHFVRFYGLGFADTAKEIGFRLFLFDGGLRKGSWQLRFALHGLVSASVKLVYACRFLGSDDGSLSGLSGFCRLTRRNDVVFNGFLRCGLSGILSVFALFASDKHHIRFRLFVRLGHNLFFDEGLLFFFTRNGSVECAEHTHVHLLFGNRIVCLLNGGIDCFRTVVSLCRFYDFLLHRFCDKARFVLLFHMHARLEFWLCVHLTEALRLLLFKRTEIALGLDFARCGGFFARLRGLRSRRLRLGLNGSVSRHKVLADCALRSVHAEFGFKFVSSHRAIRCAHARKSVVRIFYGVESCKIVVAGARTEKNISCDVSCRKFVLADGFYGTFHVVLNRALRIGIKRIERVERTVSFRSESFFVDFLLQRIARNINNIKTSARPCRVEIGDGGCALRFHKRRRLGDLLVLFGEERAFLFWSFQLFVAFALCCDGVRHVTFDGRINREKRKDKECHARRNQCADGSDDFHERICRDAQKHTACGVGVVVARKQIFSVVCADYVRA